MVNPVVPLTPEMVVASHFLDINPVGIIDGLHRVNTTDRVTSAIVEHNWTVLLDYCRIKGLDLNNPDMRDLARLFRTFFVHMLSSNPNQEEIQFGYSSIGMVGMKFPTTVAGKTYNTKQEFINHMQVPGSWGTEDLLVFCLHYLGYSITIHYTDFLQTSTRTVDHPFPIRELPIENQRSVHWTPAKIAVPGDGDCMFHSVAYLLRKDLAKHHALLSEGKSIFTKIDYLYQSLMALPLETLFNLYTIILPESTQEWMRLFKEMKRNPKLATSKNSRVYYVLENLITKKPIAEQSESANLCKAILAKNIVTHINSAKELGEAEAPTERTLIYPFENSNNVEPIIFLFAIVEFLYELLKSLKNHHKNTLSLEAYYTDPFLNIIILLLCPIFPINNKGFNSPSVVVDILKQFTMSDTKIESFDEEALKQFSRYDIEQTIKTLQNVFINHIYVIHKSFRPKIEIYLPYRKLKADFIRKTLNNDNVDSLFALYRMIMPNSKMAVLALFNQEFLKEYHKKHKNAALGEGEQALMLLSNLKISGDKISKDPNLIIRVKECLIDMIMNTYTHDPGIHKIVDDYIASNSNSTLTLQARDEAPPISVVSTKLTPH